jgi:hypothetical protein
VWEGISSAKITQRSAPPPAKDGGFLFIYDFGFAVYDWLAPTSNRKS